MNKEASDLFAKLITEIYKNQQLEQKVNQLETNINEEIEYINSLEFEEYGVLFDDGELTLNYVPNCKEKLLEILKGSDK